jgi:hypothetical protein
MLCRQCFQPARAFRTSLTYFVKELGTQRPTARDHQPSCSQTRQENPKTLNSDPKPRSFRPVAVRTRLPRTPTPPPERHRQCPALAPPIRSALPHRATNTFRELPKKSTFSIRPRCFRAAFPPPSTTLRREPLRATFPRHTSRGDSPTPRFEHLP